ncbi:hypothetical protein EJB05_23749, partial [Eragrostis curvula]
MRRCCLRGERLRGPGRGRAARRCGQRGRGCAVRRGGERRGCRRRRSPAPAVWLLSIPSPPLVFPHFYRFATPMFEKRNGNPLSVRVHLFFNLELCVESYFRICPSRISSEVEGLLQTVAQVDHQARMLQMAGPSSRLLLQHPTQADNEDHTNE